MMLLTLSLLAAAPAQAAVTPPAEEKRVCRRSTPTGTRMGAKSVCRTKAEWAELERGRENALSRADRNSLGLNSAELPPGSR